MSCACLVVAPDTPLAREFITDGRNGILGDFSTPDKISKKLLACLDYPSFMKPLKQKARQTVVEKYAAEKSVSTCLSIIQHLVRQPGATQFG
jgi:glycosyltransferase involved in cell wall biosynthesis